MSGCALIEYNNQSSRLRGVVLPDDVQLVRFALSRWSYIAFRLRSTDEKYTRIPVDEWVHGITETVKPSPTLDRIIAALRRCQPDIF